ncbi:MAG: LlaJI family restriction endonuclease [Prevotella sp.]|nr:LlaJI family restriction endonuclease [Prevotella sp.]
MKIFFEEYVYEWDVVKEFLHDHYVMYLKDGKVTIPYVGYYYSKKAEDSVFILPKVFININENKEEKAFGIFYPEEIIDTKNEDNPLLKSEYYDEVFNLSTWIYRAIARYQERHNPENITESVEVQNVESVNGDNSETWINIILELIRFNNEHRNLFTYIARINSQGHNKINWQKTISKVQPILQEDAPVYMQFRNKTKVINYDEELIVLFFSVLDYLHDKYHFRILRNVNYTTYPKEVEKLVVSGKGTRLLRNIRRKYFKDELVKLWQLLNVFFEKAQTMQSKSFREESLMVRNFNMVFEDMIDSLISDDTKEKHEKLKDQPDGKIVDHIYHYGSLVREDDIYYIGDSKYYKEGRDPGENSIYKQFTYAKNVIQMNMDVTSPHDKIGRKNYYDDLTEGYNITPNFFIRGMVNPNHLNYIDAELEQERDERGEPCVEKRSHHENRLFDRDTLFVLKYSINFLFVLSAYASGRVDESYKRRIWEKFRNNIIEELKRNYHFYLLQSNYDRTESIDKHFRLLNGKIFNSFKDDRILLFAYEKGMLGLPQLFNEIKEDFRIIPYQLGQDVDEALHNQFNTNNSLEQRGIFDYPKREIKESGKLAADPLIPKD